MANYITLRIVFKISGVDGFSIGLNFRVGKSMNFVGFGVPKAIQISAFGVHSPFIRKLGPFDKAVSGATQSLSDPFGELNPET